MSLRTRAAMAALSTAVLTLSVTACGGGSGTGSGSSLSPSVASSVSFAAGSTMARLSGAKKMTVGTKFDQPGFGLQGLDGKPAGFDVEMAKIIAGKLGIQPDGITFKETPSKVREEVIERGEVDLVIATYTINDKRKARVSFAGPYYVAGQQVMVKKEDSAITGPESLKTNASAKVCSVTGSTPAETIKTYLANPAQLVTFDVYSKCADALRTGQVQAMTTDNVILLGLISKSQGSFKLVGEKFTQEPYGVGIRKGDTSFCEFINTSLKEAADSGAYEKAWTSTAGGVEGAEKAQLPPAGTCS
ncbi:MAG: glutamate transport system substrate-binding protein [Actinomycetota bacterium]|nr:glutamate transport system substrate-binding protein [Actinomycetota bacterium]